MFSNVQLENNLTGVQDILRTGFETLGVIPREINVSPWGAVMLTTVRAAFPRETEVSELKQHILRVNFAAEMSNFTIAMNDHIDLQSTAQEPEKATLEAQYQSTKSTLVSFIDQMPSTEKTFYSSLVSNYETEITFLENYARNSTKSPQELSQYRQLMNSINIWHISAGLFGENKLNNMGFSEMLPIISEISMDNLEQKYSWMMSQNPKSGPHRKFASLFQAVMGMQVTDDWIDRASDKDIKAPSLFSVIEKNTTPKNMKTLRDSYYKKAEEFGLSHGLVECIKKGFTLFKFVLSKSAHNDRLAEHRVVHSITTPLRKLEQRARKTS